MIKPITYEEAAKLAGDELPEGMNWYHASNLQFYPNYGDWKFTWMDGAGISAIIGKSIPCEELRQKYTEAERVGA